jgi:hypothetical protein
LNAPVLGPSLVFGAPLRAAPSVLSRKPSRLAAHSALEKLAKELKLQLAAHRAARWW